MKPEKVATATTVFFAASLRLSAAETTVEQTTNHIHHSRPRSLIRKRSNRDQRQLNHIYVQSAKDPSIRFPNSLSSGTGTPKRGQCLDYSSYRSKIGSTCETIRQAGLNCDGFTDLGFTPSETDELKMACPIACGLCTDAAADPDPITISTNSPTIAPSASTKKDSGTSSMGTCFDDSCADDPLYVGKLNIDCATIRSGSFDCTKFGVMSYDDNEIAELIEKCPCACNVECIVSNTPSGMPSIPPSVQPSVHPTSHPSASPSVGPSVGPSAAPSAEPSTIPSSSPSAPPSAPDSASPSTSPSWIPTISHSNAPSRSPVSPAPFMDPTTSPTDLPLANPTGMISNATANQTAAFLSLCLVLMSSLATQIAFF